MIICGIKLTHDGAVAVIKDNKLLFCDELEKIDNNNRYSEIMDVKVIEDVLKRNNLSLESVNLFAIDGWGGYDQDKLAIQPRLTIGDNHNFVSVVNKNATYDLPVSAYEEKSLKDELIIPKEFNKLNIGNKSYSYHSYLHVAGHVMSAYATSPFSSAQEDSYILIWDGGMYPRLYYFEQKKNSIINLGPLSFWVGNIYTIFSQHFGPFKIEGDFAKDDLSVAGKVMAYIAKGEVKEELFEIFEDIYYEKYNFPMGFANVFANEFKKKILNKYSDEDILASFHKYMELHLIKKLKKKINVYNFDPKNLAIAGGCGLNIKWNSAIRDSGIFKNIYVPPFPNDSGSAIGTACCANFYVNKISNLEWSVYSGPGVVHNAPGSGWSKKKCDIKELAKFIYESNEPVVIMNGRAELGPRALGNRSIVANPGSAKMKDILNNIKKRESYRPISPICLEEEAFKFFSPDISDRFMLFDYQATNLAKKNIPAVLHIDNTARLQTVSLKDNSFLYKLLICYYKISGIPILCNTSANMHGKGFFPDIRSVTSWGKVNYVWCENMIYIKNEKNKYE